MRFEPVKIAYLAFKFSGDPTGNTEQARQMAIQIMKKHPDWFVFVPHYAIDALLDGTIKWKGKTNFSKWRRSQAGIMCIGFLTRSDILILGCEPTYENSSGVTWEFTFTSFFNQTFRKNSPLKIMSYEEAIK